MVGLWSDCALVGGNFVQMDFQSRFRAALRDAGLVWRGVPGVTSSLRSDSTPGYSPALPPGGFAAPAARLGRGRGSISGLKIDREVGDSGAF